MLAAMEGELRGLTPERGGAIDFGALLQGVSLLLLLVAFAAGAFLMLPGTSAEAPDGAQLSLPDDEVGPSPVAFSQHADTHLIIIIDDDVPLSAAGITREMDSGLNWVGSVEVIHASPAALQGLREAIDLAAATCASADCPQIVVLDLRAPPAVTD